ncbi:MAG: GTPase HflX [Gammaproteobacteria bacterium]
MPETDAEAPIARLIEISEPIERAFLVGAPRRGTPDAVHAEDHIEELARLADTAGARVVGELVQRIERPNPRHYVGEGKLEELKQRLDDEDATLVLFDDELSPAQGKNLERELNRRVMDRAEVILDIFATRAKSKEAKLQVELAQLEYLLPRLARMWVHLSRIRGGIGLRGPGETQLETDRRLIGGRIKMLLRRLEKVDRQREQGRRNRRRNDVHTVSLVGYTNAGKSTLFNHLTGSHVLSVDKLFATLDPTVRKLELENVGPIVLADTVGFVRDLPHDLVAAFRSTLQETRDADLLLHVVDAGDPLRRERIETVNRVLREIGAENVPQIEVFNKIDLAGGEPRIEHDEDGRVRRVWLSARTGAGLSALEDAVRERFRHDRVSGWLHLGPAQGRARSRLFDLGAVRREEPGEQGGWHVEIEMSERDYRQLCRHEGIPSAALTE